MAVHEIEIRGARGTAEAWRGRTALFERTEVRQLVGDPRSSAREIAEAMAGDRDLCRRILCRVNSGYYSLRHIITSVRHAIALLGMNEVRAVLMQSDGDSAEAEVVAVSGPAAAATMPVRGFATSAFTRGDAADLLEALTGRLLGRMSALFERFEERVVREAAQRIAEAVLERLPAGGACGPSGALPGGLDAEVRRIPIDDMESILEHLARQNSRLGE